MYRLRAAITHSEGCRLLQSKPISSQYWINRAPPLDVTIDTRTVRRIPTSSLGPTSCQSGAVTRKTQTPAARAALVVASPTLNSASRRTQHCTLHILFSRSRPRFDNLTDAGGPQPQKKCCSAGRQLSASHTHCPHPYKVASSCLAPQCTCLTPHLPHLRRSSTRLPPRLQLAVPYTNRAVCRVWPAMLVDGR